jgi:large subunit ribosomal protein L19
MDISSLVQNKETFKMPAIEPGDTVKISCKIIEGDKERIQVFQGVVIKIKHGGNGASYTVRHVAFGIGVERTFPMNSPMVEKIEVVRQGKVRRSKLYYLRGLSGKEARRKIKRVERAAAAVGEEILQQAPEEEIIPVPAAPVEAGTAAAPEVIKEAPVAEKKEKAPAAEKKAAEPKAEKPAAPPKEEK